MNFFKKENKWPRILLVVVMLLTICFHFYRITDVKEVVFDEVYFAKFGQDYLTFSECPEYMKDVYGEDKGCYDVHPPLGKLLIAIGEKMFGLSDFRDYEVSKLDYEKRKIAAKTEAERHAIGDFHYEFKANQVFGWRFMPSVFGIIFVFLMYVLGTQLFKNEWLGLLAAGFAAFDNYFLAQSRLALIDIFMIVFQISALIVFIKAYTTKTSYKYLWYAVSGVCAGLALGVKFNGMAVVGIMLAVLLYDVFIEIIREKRQKIDKLIKLFVHNVVVFAAIIGIGLLTFSGVIRLPEAIFGHPFPWESDLEQKYNYHKGLVADHPYASKWDKWPLSYKPVFYYYRKYDDFNPISGENKGTIRAINGHGNPFLWWFGDLALIVMLLVFVCWTYAGIYRVVTGRDMSLRSRNSVISKIIDGNKINHWPEVVIIVGFLASWIPWMFIERIAFLYHFLPSVPFLFLAAVWFIKRIWNVKDWGKIIVGIILFVVVVSFFHYFPISIGSSLNEEQYNIRIYKLYR